MFYLFLLNFLFIKAMNQIVIERLFLYDASKRTNLIVISNYERSFLLFLITDLYNKLNLYNNYI